MDCSYKAQVSAVFDMDGHIHPRWLRFRNSLGEVVTVEKLTVEEEGPNENISLQSFRCSTYMYGRRQEFCLCYSINSHSWTIEYRSTESGYRYLLSKDRREFSQRDLDPFYLISPIPSSCRYSVQSRLSTVLKASKNLQYCSSSEYSRSEVIFCISSRISVSIDAQ